VSTQIGSAMKSVGEVMAIGRKSEEALKKALRMLEIGVTGLVGNDNMRFEDIECELSKPTSEPIFVIPEALKQVFSIDRIYELSFIDRWFLQKIQNIVEIERKVSCSQQPFPQELLREAKQAGFADRQIAGIADVEEPEVRKQRQTARITPCVKQIDTLAAEYPANTNYLYLTYNGTEDDVIACEKKSVLVL